MSPSYHNMVVHQAALGDWVLTWPIIRGLIGTTIAAAHHSHAQLAQQLLPQVAAVDADHPEMTLLFAQDGAQRASQTLRSQLADLQTVISFVSRGDDAWAHNVHALAPHAGLFFIDPQPPTDWSQHASAWHMQQLAQQGFFCAPVTAARKDDGEHIVVHPGSGGAGKCWSAAHFESVITQLRAMGHQVIPVLGEVELDTWSADQLESWRGHGAVTCEALSTLAQVLEGACAYVGNDSGPTHLAAQMGIRTLALFGPTDPRVWQPLGPIVRVLAPPHPTAMDWLSPQQVLAEVKALLLE